MSDVRRMFSICIPAYNRAKFLPELLESIYAQDLDDFEIVICEDLSRERPEIAKIAKEYGERYPGTLKYIENSENLGYDANIRNLVEKSAGRFCFFMGNDDLMCKGALKVVASALSRHSNIGFVLKSYAWFDVAPTQINQEVRYFSEERVLKAGREAISFCFRRAGVISGLIIHRDASQNASSSNYDGTLYYQMHITADVLVNMNAVCLPTILVLSRNSEPPEFGNSLREKGTYVPGRYTPEARLNMISGVVQIANDLDKRHELNIATDIMRDYANYFYPYIRDQLSLPLKSFFSLYRAFGKIGFAQFPMFHFYCVICYCVGEQNFDKLTKFIRNILGRSPHFGGFKD